MEKASYKARAKINLGLDVCGKLDNGYHVVKMIMQEVDLYDVISFRKREDPDIILSVESDDYLGDITGNLIFRAAKLMKEYYSIRQGIEIHLEKRIPVAAGMAGGSTDAATTMIAMNEMFELGQTREQLMELAVSLGADIPFCILGGTALAEGIGEKLSSLPAPRQCVLLIAKPNIMVSTREVYERLDAKEIKDHPDIDAMVQSLQTGDFDKLVGKMGNVLETVTIELHPVIQDIKDTMKACGAQNAMMSGSGPTVFGIFHNQETADKAMQEIKNRNLAKQCAITSFYNE